MFHGQHTPPLDQVLYETYFQGSRGKTILEAGAVDGHVLSVSRFFEEELDWRAILLEPVPTVYQQLIKNRPRAMTLNVALDQTEGEARFVQALHPVTRDLHGNGSISHTLEHTQTLVNQRCTFTSHQVPTITYARLVRILGLQRLDLMILDVEGLELRVIDGMYKATVLPEILTVEVDHVGLSPVVERLEPLGYRYEGCSFDDAIFSRR
jgi:FkbM family methyltransferase